MSGLTEDQIKRLKSIDWAEGTTSEYITGFNNGVELVLSMYEDREMTWEKPQRGSK